MTGLDYDLPSQLLEKRAKLMTTKLEDIEKGLSGIAAAKEATGELARQVGGLLREENAFHNKNVHKPSEQLQNNFARNK